MFRLRIVSRSARMCSRPSRIRNSISSAGRFQFSVLKENRVRASMPRSAQARMTSLATDAPR